MNIAIVGVGLSGSTILRSIIEHENFNKIDNIYIFEKREKLGTGMAYEEDSLAKKLNSRANLVSVDENDKDDFINWMRENYDSNFNPIDYMVSRTIYGRYVNERFSPYYNNSKVKLIKEEVIDIEIEDDCKYYKIKTTTSSLDTKFDNVFICNGHPEYSDHYNLKGSKNYIHNPYPLENMLSNLDNNKRLGIIGTGATSIDVYRYLMENYEFKNKIEFLALDNSFKISEIPLKDNNLTFSFSEKWIENSLKENNNTIPFKLIFNQISLDFKENNIDFYKIHNEVKEATFEIQQKVIEEYNIEISKIQKYFSNLSNYTEVLYANLPILDRDKYLEEYADLLEFYMGPPPIETMKSMIKDYNEGRIGILKNLKEIKAIENGFKVHLDKEENFDVIINATGFDFNLKRGTLKSQLLKNLYNKNIIKEDIKGNFISVTWPSLKVLSKKYGQIDSLRWFGLWVSSTHHRNNDIGSIMRVAKKVTKKFMDEILN